LVKKQIEKQKILNLKILHILYIRVVLLIILKELFCNIKQLFQLLEDLQHIKYLIF